MSDKSKISWTGSTFNPVVGCTKVSPGCNNCYAERMAGRLANMGQIKYMSVVSQKNGTGTIRYNKKAIYLSKWNGKTFCDESALEIPLHWRKPRRIFVCSMGDLFHKSVPFEFIAKVFQTISACQQHTFQILTKRPERMKDFINGCGNWEGWITHNGSSPKDAYDGTGITICSNEKWPLPNLWLGVTAENQEQADKRIPILLQIPAAVRFVSVEPMLGAVDLENITMELPSGAYVRGTVLGSDGKHFTPGGAKGTGLDWVIVGCESGPKRRECKIEWVRDIVKQCKAASVPVFVKQLSINGKVSKDMAEWPEDLRIQDYPDK